MSAATRGLPPTRRPPTLRLFLRPRRWLAGGLLLIAAVAVASLLPSSQLPPPPFSGADKLEHFLAYALLSAYAVMLFARMRGQALAALALVALGVGIELAQGGLTESRMTDSADALANTIGVLAGLLVAATPAARWLQRLDARLG